MSVPGNWVVEEERLVKLTATEIQRHLAAGAFTVTQLVQACLRQIDRLDGKIRAWVHLDPEAALSRALALDHKRQQGEPGGALCGVPVGVKDIFNTVDMPTAMGSPIWAGFTPGNDARAVFYLRQADAVIPGKTVTAEFAVHTPGPTVNPHRSGFSPGTSSSGSAAAVAAGMVPLAIGTQTAGSIIRPASYCGVYGFKPSFGVIPRTGMLKTTDTLDTVGMFSRSVEDLALLFEVIRVRGADYPVIEQAFSDCASLGRDSKPWRVAVVKGPKWDHAEAYAQRALLDLARTLAKDPHIRVEEFSLPEEFRQAHDIHSIIYDRALAYYFKREFLSQELVSEIMRQIIVRGNQVSAGEYTAALGRQNELANRLDAFLSEIDIILDLSTGGAALPGLDAVDRPDHCLIWTLCRVPTINLPVFRAPNDLPFGAQILARRYSDYRLLQFARYLRNKELISDASLSAALLEETPDVGSNP